MKKVLAIIMCLVIVLVVGGCGKEKDDRYEKIIYKDGTVETLKHGEICTLASLNNVAYNQKYAENKVEVVDTVLLVNRPSSGVVNILIDLSGGVTLSLFADNPIITDLMPGTKIKVVGVLSRGATATIDELYGNKVTIEIIE